AYRRYNNLGSRDEVPLLVFNISRFYARQPVSPVIDERRKLISTLMNQLDAFSAELLAEASRRAQRAGDPLIRSSEAAAAVQQLMPHRIDQYEDTHVFGRLPENERMMLEAYDCDSFRDFGAHWWSLRRAAHAAPDDSLLPDPFAAEIVAEAVSAYAVLLLRVAGELAREGGDTVRLLPDDLVRAVPVIRERAARHHATPEEIDTQGRIVSAASTGADEPGVAEPAARAFFSDVTAEVGIGYTHRSATWLGEFRHKQLKTPPTFSGGGVAADDVDGDGDTDLLFVGGGGNALLLDDGGGRFVDGTRDAGIAWQRADGSSGEARQPIIADFDNDGRQDILISYVNDDHRLFRNVGGARFEDVTPSCGLGGAGLIGGPVTVFDFDLDGLLDVYIGYFGDYVRGAIPSVDRNNQNALPNRLFRNVGGMRFEDVTEGSGTDDVGWTQAVSHVDFDRDGLQDIVVANDYGRNAFLRNLGSGKFEDVAAALGITESFHSMNVGIADLNDDDFPDIYISNIAMLVKDNKYVFPDVNTPMDFDLRAMAGMLTKESDMFYMSHLENGRLARLVPSKDVERGATSTGWAWDAEFFDFDHDGDDDLYLVNGTNDFNTYSMVYRPKDAGSKGRELLLDHRRETNVFFLNEDGKLKNASARSGIDIAQNSRSTAYLDYDGDGDLDIALNNFHAPAN
ncbi:MAG TPA: VCBS repeat-containing protein, partial [Gammaproteobacteria bacterium]|nr:VCBS repeat-containing protein [Gammaproteobacteria bacterium]